MTDYYGTAAPRPAGFGRPDYVKPPSTPAADINWCDDAGCPRAECVACQNRATA